MRWYEKRLLTGLQPSGDLHIGNYFGALKPFLDIYQKYESFLMVADYHALTSKIEPDELRKNIFNIVRSYLAVGIDQSKVVVFKQSDVSEHTELAWIFNTLVTVPFLMQGHAYKDKVAKGLEASAGLFTYPMLMAATFSFMTRTWCRWEKTSASIYVLACSGKLGYNAGKSRRRCYTFRTCKGF